MKENDNYALLWFAAKRLLTLIPTILGVTFITYGLMYLSPADPVEMLLQAQGIPISPEVVQIMKEESGLDQPFLMQYFTWLGNFLTGDMGVSLINGDCVAVRLKTALPKTMLLTASSITLTILISIPVGILAAVKQNQLIDYSIRFFSFLGNSLPNFFLSLLLIYVLSLKLGWLPVMASGDISGLILPTLALALPMSGRYIRQVRGAVLDQIGKDYVNGAISRGIREKVILFRSVMRNAIVTILTLLALSIGSLLGGTAAVERIFVWRGMGYMMMDAIMMRDYPVIQAFVVWISIIYIFANLVADLLYFALDPRVRKGLGVTA